MTLSSHANKSTTHDDVYIIRYIHSYSSPLFLSLSHTPPLHKNKKPPEISHPLLTYPSVPSVLTLIEHVTIQFPSPQNHKSRLVGPKRLPLFDIHTHHIACLSTTNPRDPFFPSPTPQKPTGSSRFEHVEAGSKTQGSACAQ